MKQFKPLTLLFLMGLCTTINAQKGPQFKNNQDPKPTEAKWKLVKNMSDEFDGEILDKTKWLPTAKGWIGRAPGLFVDKTIQVTNGSLQITNSKLPEPVVEKGKTFTHAGGLVASVEGRTYGYYECEMKASNTFMSSTFWLINERGNETGCDKRTTELDIQECIGQITCDKVWCQATDKSMGSNLHSRGIQPGCDIKTASIGAKGNLEKGKVYDDFHTYGVWWKDKNEVQFFLDGKLVKKVIPPADFNIPMHLRMVTETYDWNPVPADGGMNGSVAERTTTYNWIRTWELEE
ncbi:family 16 glycosylhydrolase [Flavobacterium ovatum]|uniref:family 16 glycosylhydrolase n=1 Tax=Flavobacterium ovatum TaxID=1928857 RepID=UPI00344C2C55